MKYSFLGKMACFFILGLFLVSCGNPFINTSELEREEIIIPVLGSGNFTYLMLAPDYPEPDQVVARSFDSADPEVSGSVKMIIDDQYVSTLPNGSMAITGPLFLESPEGSAAPIPIRQANMIIDADGEISGTCELPLPTMGYFTGFDFGNDFIQAEMQIISGKDLLEGSMEAEGSFSDFSEAPINADKIYYAFNFGVGLTGSGLGPIPMDLISPDLDIPELTVGFILLVDPEDPMYYFGLRLDLLSILGKKPWLQPSSNGSNTGSGSSSGTSTTGSGTTTGGTTATSGGVGTKIKAIREVIGIISQFDGSGMGFSAQGEIPFRIEYAFGILQDFLIASYLDGDHAGDPLLYIEEEQPDGSVSEQLVDGTFKYYYPGVNQISDFPDSSLGSQYQFVCVDDNNQPLELSRSEFNPFNANFYAKGTIPLDMLTYAGLPIPLALSGDIAIRYPFPSMADFHKIYDGTYTGSERIQFATGVNGELTVSTKAIQLACPPLKFILPLLEFGPLLQTSAVVDLTYENDNMLSDLYLCLNFDPEVESGLGAIVETVASAGEALVGSLTGEGMDETEKEDWMEGVGNVADSIDDILIQSLNLEYLPELRIGAYLNGSTDEGLDDWGGLIEVEIPFDPIGSLLMGLGPVYPMIRGIVNENNDMDTADDLIWFNGGISYGKNAGFRLNGSVQNWGLHAFNVGFIGNVGFDFGLQDADNFWLYVNGDYRLALFSREIPLAEGYFNVLPEGVYFGGQLGDGTLLSLAGDGEVLTTGIRYEGSGEILSYPFGDVFLEINGQHAALDASLKIPKLTTASIAAVPVEDLATLDLSGLETLYEIPIDIEVPLDEGLEIHLDQQQELLGLETQMQLDITQNGASALVAVDYENPFVEVSGSLAGDIATNGYFNFEGQGDVNLTFGDYDWDLANGFIKLNNSEIHIAGNINSLLYAGSAEGYFNTSGEFLLAGSGTLQVPNPWDIDHPWELLETQASLSNEKISASANLNFSPPGFPFYATANGSFSYWFADKSFLLEGTGSAGVEINGMDCNIASGNLRVTESRIDADGSMTLPGLGSLVVTGFCDNTGNYSFTGDGSLCILGYSLDATATIANDRIAASGNVAIGIGGLSGTAAVAGEFRSLSDFSLAGNGNLSFSSGGFSCNLASGTFGLTPSRLDASGSVSLPGLGSLAVSGYCENNGNFSLTGRGNLSVLGYNLADVMGTVTNNSVAVSGSASIGYGGFSANVSGSGTFRSLSNFDFSGSGSVSVYGHPLTSGTVSFNQNSFTATGNLSLYGFNFGSVTGSFNASTGEGSVAGHLDTGTQSFSAGPGYGSIRVILDTTVGTSGLSASARVEYDLGVSIPGPNPHFSGTKQKSIDLSSKSITITIHTPKNFSVTVGGFTVNFI